MKQYWLKIINAINRFLKNQIAAVSIEIAFILPIFLTVIMAIFEYAMIFAIRSGIDQELQKIIRIRTTINADFSDYGIPNPPSYNPTTDTDNAKNLRTTKALHKALRGVVMDISKVSLRSKNPSKIIYELGVAYSFSSPTNFTVAAPTTAFNFGPSGFYVCVRLDYDHQFLTPLGRLIHGASQITLATAIYYYNGI